MKCNSVLIIDDNPSIRELMEELFVSENITDVVVETAEDGLEGLKALGRILRPTLVFLDWKMPNMDGQEFLDAVNRLGISEKLEIVIMTAAQNITVKPHIYQIINKPTDLQTILNIYQSKCERC